MLTHLCWSEAVNGLSLEGNKGKIHAGRGGPIRGQAGAEVDQSETSLEGARCREIVLGVYRKGPHLLHAPGREI